MSENTVSVRFNSVAKKQAIPHYLNTTTRVLSLCFPSIPHVSPLQPLAWQGSCLQKETHSDSSKKKKKKDLGLISQYRDSHIDFKWLQWNCLSCVNTFYFWLFVFMMMMMISRLSYPVEELFQTRDSSDLAAVVPKTFVFVDSTQLHSRMFYKVSVFSVFFRLYSLMEKDIHFNLEMVEVGNYRDLLTGH